MKSLFADKEAWLREELSEERDKLAREAAVLRERLEQAEAGKVAAEVPTFVLFWAERVGLSMCWALCEEMALLSGVSPTLAHGTAKASCFKLLHFGRTLS